MPPSHVELICASCLNDKAVRERLGVVRAVAHPRSLVTKCDACGVQKRSVRVTDRVPAHALLVERSHRVDEGLVRPSVVAAHREGKPFKDHLRAWREWYEAQPGEGLGVVVGADAVAGAPDPDDIALYVAWLDGDDLAPAQPGQEHELGDATPDAGHALDDLLDFIKREGMPAREWGRYPWTVRWDGDGLYHPAPDGVLEGRGEAGVDGLDGCGRVVAGQQGGGELSQVLGADLADAHRAEERLDVLDAPPVADDGVGSRSRLSLLGGEPEVKCLADGFLWRGVASGECPFCGSPLVADWRVRVPAADLAPDEPLAAALIPFGALVAASLTERGDR